MDQKYPHPQLKTRVEGNYGEFVIEPLKRGYGVTIGNPIRRILMSSIKGTAITSVYIEDVLHEFSTIPGVKEDVIQLILNLKSMVVKFHAPGVKILTLRASGAGIVRASDFQVPSDAEIINPDLEIANLSEDGSLVMEVKVEEGEGYMSAEKHQDKKDRINSISVDASFSPVERVAYNVENTRVGRQTDLDKLILRIWTKGNVSPNEVLDQAVSILREELSVFGPMEFDINNNELVEFVSNKESKEVAEYSSKSEDDAVSLEGLGLSTRVLHSLKEEGVDNVDALCALSDRDLKKVPGIGERSLDEIKQQLAHFGKALRD